MSYVNNVDIMMFKVLQTYIIYETFSSIVLFRQVFSNYYIALPYDSIIICSLLLRTTIYLKNI